MGIGVNPDYDYLFDPQQAPTAGWCPCCGAEICGFGKEACERCAEEDVE